MLQYPNISPYFLKIGNVEFRWYGLMYAFSFIIGYFLIRYLLTTKRFVTLKLTETALFDLLFFILLGVIMGGRLGYILFYNLSYYLENPLSVFAVWEGGMSFHGGLIGVVFAVLLFCRSRKINKYQVADLLVLATPIGLGLGRIGNFINGELYGRITTVPWCMEFPTAEGCRHPSQWYEFFLEGVALFLILWFLKDRVKKSGMLFWMFIFFYGIFRFVLEFFRQPDMQLGFIFSVFTMGQLLSLGMIIVAVIGIFFIKKSES